MKAVQLYGSVRNQIITKFREEFYASILEDFERVKEQG